MRSNRATLIGLAMLAVLAMGLVGFAVIHADSPDRRPNAYVPPTMFQSQAPKPMLKPAPAGSKVLIIGDSYTQGYGTDDPATQGYAPILAADYGWDARIEGVGGTGYTWGGGTDGKDGKDFPTRIAALAADPSLKPALVVLEGSQNDYRADTDAIEAAVAKAIAEVRKAWPSAQIVALGPVAPQPLGASIEPISSDISEACARAGVPFVDGIGTGWFTAENSKQYAFTDGAHLNTAGYAYLAAKTKAALDALMK